jgi:GAG-pre-integrase domain
MDLGEPKRIERSAKDLSLLHHRHLGHPSFSALSRLYSPLFEKSNKEKLMRDTCKLGKHTRSSYASSYRDIVPQLL